MALMSGLVDVRAEEIATPRHPAVFKWTRRSSWLLAVGFCIAVWSIVAALIWLV